MRGMEPDQFKESGVYCGPACSYGVRRRMGPRIDGDWLLCNIKSRIYPESRGVASGRRVSVVDAKQSAGIWGASISEAVICEVRGIWHELPAAHTTEQSPTHVTLLVRIVTLFRTMSLHSSWRLIARRMGPREDSSKDEQVLVDPSKLKRVVQTGYYWPCRGRPRGSHIVDGVASRQ